MSHTGLSDGYSDGRGRVYPARKACACPTCGHIMTQAGPPIGVLAVIQMGSTQRRVIQALIDAYPAKVTNAALVDKVWAGSADEPMTAPTIICQTMMKLRKKIAPYGWAIPQSRSGPGAEGYCLVKK